MVINAMILTAIILCVIVLFVHKAYPKRPLKRGGIAEIYIDGIHNRTATVSKVLPSAIVIYDSIHLPVHYRGRFYSVGYLDDGSKVLFIGRKRLYLLARMAELIRKITGTPEYQDQSDENVENPSDSTKEKDEEQNG